MEKASFSIGTPAPPCAMRFMYMSWPIIGPNALTCQKSHWIASDLSAASAVGSKDEGCFSQRYSMMAPLSNTAVPSAA